MTGFILRCLERLFGVMPRRSLLSLGTLLGWIWYHLIPVRRAWAHAHLCQAMPELSSTERRVILRRVFVNQVRNVLEMIGWRHLWRAPAPPWVRVEGRDLLERARAAGPVIVLTAHTGNFDLMACHEARRVPLSIISKRLSWAALNRAWMETRQRFGVDILPPERTLGAASRALDAGRVVAFVLDQHSPERRAVECTFMRTPARTSAALGTLAIRSQATVVPAFAERAADGTHILRYHEGLRCHSDGDVRQRIEALTARCLDLLEAEIRARPEQWLWLHRRWKDRQAKPLIVP